MPNRISHVLQAVALVFGLTISMSLEAYDHAFEKSPVGSVEIKELPAGRWLMTKMEGAYFEYSTDLFLRLFDYINANDISMTVPVRGGPVDAEMRFFLAEDVSRGATNSDVVEIVNEPSRTVASAGARGAYTQANLGEAQQRLNAWLERQTEWRASAEPYAVFWNGPFTLWFMKRFEIHVPVQRVSPLPQ